MKEKPRIFGKDYRWPDSRWRRIAGYPNYSVSSDGLISSWAYKIPRLLRPRKASDGLFYVQLCLRGRVITRPIHQLVLEAFAGPRPEGAIAVHINGNKICNHIYNLRWGNERITQSEQIIKILNLLQEGKTSIRKIGRISGLSSAYVSCISTLHRLGFIKQ